MSIPPKPELKVKRLYVEFEDGSVFMMEVEMDEPLPNEHETSPCCHLCGWNPKFGENRALCFCTMGRHFRISKEGPKRLPTIRKIFPNQ